MSVNTHARPTKQDRSTTRPASQRWGLAVVAALPALLVALATPLAIEGSLAGFLYAPLVLLVMAVTVGVGSAAGVAAVFLGTVAGAVIGPGGVSQSPWVGAGLAGVLLAGTWLGQVLAAGRWPIAAGIPAVGLVAGILALGITGRLEAAVLAAFTGLALVLLLVLVGPWNGTDAVRPARWAEVLTVVTMALSALTTYAVSVSSSALVGDPATLSVLGQEQPEGRTEGGVPDPFLVAARWQLEPTWLTLTLFSITAQQDLQTRPTWATFSTYNGIAWLEPPLYGVSGDDIPPETVGAPSETFDTGARVTVSVGMPGQWVPVPQRVDQVLSSVATRVDPTSGIVATVGSPIDHSFDVRYSLAVADRKQLEETFPAQVVGADPATVLPAPIPGGMAALSDTVTAQAPTLWSRLVLLSQELRDSRFAPVEPSALAAGVPDRSYVGLDRVLAEGVGYQEQYAAIWAIIARSWDVPTRLVIGFPLEQQGPAVRTVTAPEVSIWAEARLDGLGWVAFQPSPQDRLAGRPAVVRPLTPDEVPRSPEPDQGQDGGSAGDQGDGSERNSDGVIDSGEEPSGSLPWGLILGAVGLLVIVGWPLVVAWRRRRLRLSLMGGSPRESAVGAWQWARILLVESWLPLPLSYAPSSDALPPDDLPDDLATEIAEFARFLAPAVYGPEPNAGVAEEAWERVDAISRRARQVTGWRTRLRRALLPPEPSVTDSLSPARR